MDLLTSILQWAAERPAELVAILFVLFSARKVSENRRQFVRIFVGLAFAVVFLTGLPLTVVFLASSGDINILNLGWVGGWADRLALGFDFLIPCFLIILPQMLRLKLKWEDADADLQALVPTWLALHAATATVGLIFALHFIRGGQLADLGAALIIVGSVGIVGLVMPFYSLLARACWQRQFTRVINPAQWWREQNAAWAKMWDAIKMAGSLPGTVVGPGTVGQPGTLPQPALPDGGTLPGDGPTGLAAAPVPTAGGASE